MRERRKGQTPPQRWRGFTSTTPGVVPASGGGTSKYLRADGTWATPAGGGGEAFPVGSVFLSVVATDPATLLGYGTWSAIAAGKFLVGLDSGDTDFDVAEETGGAKTHTLTIGEMPAHGHTQNAHNHGVTDPGHTHGENAPSSASGGAVRLATDTNASGNVASTLSTASATTGVTVNNATATNQNTGGGGAHNNVPPYFVCYMWKRTA